jgi:hypothetical protein
MKPHHHATRLHFLHRLVLSGLLLTVLSIASAAANPLGARASVQQGSMALGQTNTYTITIENIPQGAPLAPPSVPGLVFSNTASTSRRATIINGQSSSETSFSWNFQAERVGRFTIPPREFDLQGQRLRIQAVAVEVTEMPAEMRNRFFLRWATREGPFYVGQSIPATLQLYVRGGVQASLGGNPEGSSDQFLRTPFPAQPRQSQGQINGQPFTMVEWDTVVTPIRSGPGELPVDLILLYQTGEVRRDFFGNRPVQEQIRLTTESGNWTILDLPRANRPPSFSGAVGAFEVGSRLSAREAEAGDPLTFTLEIRGEGNFERMQAPQIPEVDGWRVYPPRARMAEGDVPYRGVKTFEYILTPIHESVSEIPAVAFSWFDPSREAWEETVLGSDPVRIRPSSSPSTPRRPAQTDVLPPSAAGSSSLLPMAQAPGRAGQLAAPWRQPLFWAFNGGMGLLAAAALVGLTRQRKIAQNPYLQLKNDATRKGRQLAALAVQAAQRQAAADFYLNATRSLRHFLAFLDPQTHNPESLTWNELEAILQKSSFAEDSLTRTRTLFNRQDAILFAGWTPTPAQLAEDREALETLLNQIARRHP